MHRADAREVADQRVARDRGEHGHAVLPALPGADQKLAARKVEVLHPQLQPFHQPEPRPVQQLTDELVGRAGRPECGEHDVHLCAREDRGQARRALRPRHAVQPRQRRLEHDTVKEEQRGPGLILRGRAHAVTGGEVGEERLNGRDVERGRVPVTAVVHEAADPADVRLLGARAVVPHAHGGAQRREQARPGGRGRR